MLKRAAKSGFFLLSLGLLLVFFLKGSGIQVPSGTWAPAGNMAEARSGASSVLLQDGTILVTGGEGTSGMLSSAEFFSAGSFAAAPAMNVARSGHAAVVLDDGRVLATGGKTTGGSVTNAAEIYSPALNSWIVIGSMADARSGHTATLLKDGRVLLAGGEGSAGAVSTLEVFDPTTGAFAFAGTMSSARKNHAAALLADGRVLIAGGFDGSAALASSQIFDPETNTLVFGAPLSEPRAGLSATTLLDGKVLVAGGTNSTGDLATAEVYSPITGAFSPAGSMSAARKNHLAFLLPHNSHVLILGGTSGGTALGTAELFRPWTGAFVATDSLAAARSGSTGSPLALDGLLLITGGANQASSELYGFATVKTDKDDYAPGEIVTITGSGWQPGETVTMVLHEANNPEPHEDLTLTAVADALGKVFNQQFAPELHDLGIRFYLTASGTNSKAQTTFTDSQPQSVTLAPTSRSVAPGGSAAYEATVGMGGSSNNTCTVTLEVTTALPAGAVAAFSGGNNPFDATNVDFSRTLTITTTGATPPGTYPFTVRATRGSNCPGSAASPTTNGTLIVFGTATNLAFGQQPTNTESTSPITPAITVRVLDANNNVVANSSAAVTLAIGTNPGGGTLSGTLTQNAVNGVATFSGLSINKVGTGYTLTASSGGLAGATSNLFDITVGPAAQLVFTTQPVGGTAGSPFTTQPVVSVQDAGGNVKTSGAGSGATITLSIVPGTGTAGAVLTCTGGLGKAATNGVATFAGCSINLAGTGYRLRASTTILGSTFTVDSSLFNIAAANTTPTVTANDQAFPEGTSTSYSASWSDGSDSSQTHTCTIDFGDGTGAQVGVISPAQPSASGTCSLSHTYADGPNSYTITVTVNDGTINGSDTAIATVNNVAPIISLSGAASVNEGSAYSLTLGSVVDPGSDTVTGYTIHWGDASSESFGGSPNGLTKTHTYADGPNNYIITVDLVDEDGTYAAAGTKAITVNNVTPTIALTGANSVDEGSSYSLNLGSVVDPGTDTVASYTVKWGDGNNENFSGSPNGLTKTHTYADGPNNYTITVDLVDEDATHAAAGSKAITVNNVAPTITSSDLNLSATAVNENDSVTLSGSFIDPGTQDTHTVTIEWGDGSANTTLNLAAGVLNFAPQSHQYRDDNPTGTPSDNYAIKVTVKDKDNDSGNASKSITVNNVAPTLSNVAATSPINENGSATLTGDVTDPGTLDTFTLTINWGDGSGPQTVNLAAGTLTFSVNHTYLDDNPTGTPSDTNAVSVTLTDDDTGSDTKSTSVTVNNVAPTLSNVAVTSPINENGTAMLTGNITDPGTLDTFNLTINWGDGSGPQTVSLAAGTLTFSVNHTYLDDNPTGTASDVYSIGLTLADDDTGSTTASASVTVNNVIPGITYLTSTPTSINENQSVGLSGTFIDPGTLDTHSLYINWGDGTAPETIPLVLGARAFSVSHQHLDDNPTGTPSDINSITVKVLDDDLGISLPMTQTVTVSNVAPVISSINASPSLLAVGSPTTVTLNFSDVGTKDTHSCRFAWDAVGVPDTVVNLSGSGNTSCFATQTYTAAGVYLVGVTLTDDDTGSASTTFEYVVVYDPSAGFVTGGGWIQSPAGAYVADASLTGKANFGFVSKYQKASSIPTGETEFQLHFATFNFHSTEYQWLVVAGAKAQYKGKGKLNGLYGSNNTSGYGFLLTATDGQLNGGGGVDRFRIKIWDIYTNAVVYDNVPSASEDIDAANPQAIGGGSINIQAPKK